MNQIVTKGIVLTRTNYGEADRILTLLTPDYGKLRLMAKGVRKSKSKLAGGIELFSISDITFIRGRGEVGTLVSSRLKAHYSDIVKDIDRTMLAYELIKQLNRATEDECEPEYFDLMELALAALDDLDISSDLVQLWFSAQLLKRGGHTPDLQTDKAGSKLDADKNYTFSFDDMAFSEGPASRFTAQHIKLLRLLFSSHTVQAINKVQGVTELLKDITPLIQTMRTTYIRV
jgi:DNA repair protein RecO